MNEELLKAISDMMDEKLKPIHDRLEILEIKNEVTQRKLDDLTFQVASINHHNTKEFAKLNDEMETLIAVLEAKNILKKVE